jgi:hypothetical protein
MAPRVDTARKRAMSGRGGIAPFVATGVIGVTKRVGITMF